MVVHHVAAIYPRTVFMDFRTTRNINFVPSRGRLYEDRQQVEQGAWTYMCDTVSPTYAFILLVQHFTDHFGGQEAYGMQQVNVVNHDLNRSMAFSLVEVVSCYP